MAAALIDTVLIMALIWPLLLAVYGFDGLQSRPLVPGVGDILINYVLPAVVVIVFWIYRSATPGKMILKLKIIDAKTGGELSTGQCIGRYFAYYASIIPFMLGIIWVGFDDRKQGWHDKLAGTLVVREP